MIAVTGASATLTRRRFLITGSSATATMVGGIARPYLSRAADRPVITHGIASGDVEVASGVVWARADRPARMLVEAATTESFSRICSAVFADALPETDYTANALLKNNAVFQDFEPFWEFVSGPIHAGTWPPGKLDNTFGPRAVYQKGCSKEQGENLAPCFGLQFFGHVAIDGVTEVMTVTLKNMDNCSLWSTRIEPRPQQWPGVISADRSGGGRNRDTLVSD